MKTEENIIMKYCCNPININYRYQFNADPRLKGLLKICREAADPSMIRFKDRYYIFASMTLGVWVSDDLAVWENHPLPKELPLYDYAPDVRVIGDRVYFCASSRDHKCDRWYTEDILNGPYIKVEGTFPYWDPNLFRDDDGRIYFYWGCSNMTPIFGTELDPVTMNPVGETKELIHGDPYSIGYERIGENNSVLPCSEEELNMKYAGYLKRSGITEDRLPPGVAALLRGMLSNRPYIEGAWMDKKDGVYYLQYAAPGTQYNTYSDGVYKGSSPLGPFVPAENNPYSYKPGGFIPGAGHGSSMEDQDGSWWHASTMRISKNHDFERRVGIWPAGIDQDGEMFCNQRYGDWPMNIEKLRKDPWADPEWMLLSAGRPVRASSETEGHPACCASEENVQTWWQAASDSTDEWLELDLTQVSDVRAVQVNFADDKIDIPCPGQISQGSQPRYIEEAETVTRWKLEGSADGNTWFVIADKSDAETDLTHDLIVCEDGIRVRLLRLSGMKVPYGQKPCISGLRVFGKGCGEKPAVPAFTAVRDNDLDMTVSIEAQQDALGWNILFGSAPDRLYHSYMVFSSDPVRIGALIKGRNYFVRVDAFNENGITEGVCAETGDR